jgi:hypothetical protein
MPPRYSANTVTSAGITTQPPTPMRCEGVSAGVGLPAAARANRQTSVVPG